MALCPPTPRRSKRNVCNVYQCIIVSVIHCITTKSLPFLKSGARQGMRTVSGSRAFYAIGRRSHMLSCLLFLLDTMSLSKREENHLLFVNTHWVLLKFSKYLFMWKYEGRLLFIELMHTVEIERQSSIGGCFPSRSIFSIEVCLPPFLCLFWSMLY